MKARLAGWSTWDRIEHEELMRRVGLVAALVRHASPGVFGIDEHLVGGWRALAARLQSHSSACRTSMRR